MKNIVGKNKPEDYFDRRHVIYEEKEDDSDGEIEKTKKSKHIEKYPEEIKLEGDNLLLEGDNLLSMIQKREDENAGDGEIEEKESAKVIDSVEEYDAGSKHDVIVMSDEGLSGRYKISKEYQQEWHLSDNYDENLQFCLKQLGPSLLVTEKEVFGKDFSIEDYDRFMRLKDSSGYNKHKSLSEGVPFDVSTYQNAVSSLCNIIKPIENDHDENAVDIDEEEQKWKQSLVESQRKRGEAPYIERANETLDIQTMSIIGASDFIRTLQTQNEKNNVMCALYGIAVGEYIMIKNQLEIFEVYSDENQKNINKLKNDIDFLSKVVRFLNKIYGSDMYENTKRRYAKYYNKLTKLFDKLLTQGRKEEYFCDNPVNAKNNSKE